MTEQEATKEIERHIWYLRETWKPHPDYNVIEALGMAIKALEKQMPKKIIGTEEFPVYVGDTVSGICPECMTDFTCITPLMYKARGFGNCKRCGQKLDWRGTE